MILTDFIFGLTQESNNTFFKNVTWNYRKKPEKAYMNNLEYEIIPIVKEKSIWLDLIYLFIFNVMLSCSKNSYVQSKTIPLWQSKNLGEYKTH